MRVKRAVLPALLLPFCCLCAPALCAPGAANIGTETAGAAALGQAGNLTLAQEIDEKRLTAAVQELEAKLGARAGVAVIRPGSAAALLPGAGAAAAAPAAPEEFFYQADERFAMCSTFKLLLCAAALQRGPEFYERLLQVSEGELLSWAPKTRQIAGSKASVLELCEMFMSVSDNTAANLVLKELGGPAALTAFVRSLRDKVTRLDRCEPELNEAVPGDLRDTTTPRSMAFLLAKLLYSDALPEHERNLFYQLLASNETSAGLLKAAAPEGLAVADRTGAGGFGSRGIAAIVGSLGEEALVVVIYLTETKADLSARDLAVSELGRALFAEFFAL